MQKFSRKFKAGVSAAAVLVVLFGVYGSRKLQALAADPDGEKDCRTAPAATGKIDLERVKAIAPLQGVTWSQLGGSHQRCELPQQDRDLRRRRGAQRRRHRQRAGVRARQQAHGHGGRRAPQHGRARVPQGRHRARHARASTASCSTRAARTMTVQPGATWHDIQNVLHPRFAVRAMQSTDIFSRRRLDLGQRPRHGPSGRRDGEVDQVDARDAGGRHAADGLGDREQGAVRSRGRRLRAVRRHRRGRARYRRQPRLPDRPAHARLQGISRRCSPARSRRTRTSR